MKIIGKIVLFALILATAYFVFLFLNTKPEVQAPVVSGPTGNPVMTPPSGPPPSNEAGTFDVPPPQY